MRCGLGSLGQREQRLGWGLGMLGHQAWCGLVSLARWLARYVWAGDSGRKGEERSVDWPAGRGRYRGAHTETTLVTRVAYRVRNGVARGLGSVWTVVVGEAHAVRTWVVRILCMLWTWVAIGPCKRWGLGLLGRWRAQCGLWSLGQCGGFGLGLLRWHADRGRGSIWAGDLGC